MKYTNKFCTVLNCMDGRVQLPVIKFLKNYFDTEFIDSITESGPINIIAERKLSAKLKSIYKKINISIEKHNSVGLAVVGHFNFLGNKVNKKVQIEQTKISTLKLKKIYPEIEIIEHWVDRNWKVNKVKI